MARNSPPTTALGRVADLLWPGCRALGLTWLLGCTRRQAWRWLPGTAPCPIDHARTVSVTARRRAAELLAAADLLDRETDLRASQPPKRRTDGMFAIIERDGPGSVPRHGMGRPAGVPPAEQAARRAAKAAAKAAKAEARAAKRKPTP